MVQSNLAFEPAWLVPVGEVYDHTRPSRVVCILSMHVYVYIEYVAYLFYIL